MRRLGKIIPFVALIVALLLPLGITVAQEDKALTEEEKALVERFAEAITQPESYSRYAFFADESSVGDLTVELDGASQNFRNTQTITREGYTFINPDGLDERRADLHLVYADIAPAGVISYVLDGEARLVDETLYANLAYTSQTGEVPELPTGWQSFTSPDDFPIGLALMKVGDWFDESPATLETYTTQLVDYVTTVEFTTETLADSATLDVITIVLEGDDLVGFFTEAVEPNPDNQSFIDLISDPNVEKSWTIQLKLNAAGQRVYLKTILSYKVSDLDGAELNMTAGSKVTISSILTHSVLRSDFDGAFEPIVAPIIPPTVAPSIAPTESATAE